MQEVYKNTGEYNIDKKCKMLIIFDMIADIVNKKKLNPVVTELFIRGRKFLFLNQTLRFQRMLD